MRAAARRSRSTRSPGAPIKFVGVGEKLAALEPFYPDRLASRILGMGDVLTLIEKTQSVYSEEQAKDLAQKLRKNDFTLDDFLDQLRQVRKMGSMNDIMKMIPGLSKALPNVDIDEGDVKRVEAIICSMTRRERRAARDPLMVAAEADRRRERDAGCRR